MLLSETFRAPVPYPTCSPGGAAPPDSGNPATDENVPETPVRPSSSRRTFHRCAFGVAVSEGGSVICDTSPPPSSRHKSILAGAHTLINPVE